MLKTYFGRGRQRHGSESQVTTTPNGAAMREGDQPAQADDATAMYEMQEKDGNAFPSLPVS